MSFEKLPSKDSAGKPENNGDDKMMSRRNFLKVSSSAVALGLGADILRADTGIILRESNPVSGEILDIPTEEKIENTFNILRQERPCRERRKLQDEKGVYLWELEFPIEGGTAEFSYMRKGRYKVGGSAIATKIYICFFDTDGMPIGGHDVALYVDGAWNITDMNSLE